MILCGRLLSSDRHAVIIMSRRDRTYCAPRRYTIIAVFRATAGRVSARVSYLWQPHSAADCSVGPPRTRDRADGMHPGVRQRLGEDLDADEAEDDSEACG